MPFNDPNQKVKYYLEQQTTISLSGCVTANYVCGENEIGPCDQWHSMYSKSFDVTDKKLLDEDGICEPEACQEERKETTTFTDKYCPAGEGDPPCDPGGTEVTVIDSFLSGCNVPSLSGQTGTDFTATGYIIHIGTAEGDCGTFERKGLDEFTTSQLISFANDKLDDVTWTAWAAGVPSALALRNLNASENSVSIKKGEYMFRFPVPATCKIKIEWEEVFTPEDEDDDPTVVPKTFDWAGTGNPCWPFDYDPNDPDHSYVESDVFSFDVPAEDGSYGIQNITWKIDP